MIGNGYSRLNGACAIRHWGRNSGERMMWRAFTEGLLADRSANFLAMVRRLIFGHSGSPYLALMRRVDCEYDDIAGLMSREGLETTLKTLSASGVYVTHDEMKGREPIRRGSDLYAITSADFNNPLHKPQLIFRTSGSTGAATRIGVHLDHYRSQSPHTEASLQFHGLEDCVAAVWLPISEWSASRLLRLAVGRVSIRRWYTPVPIIPPAATWEGFGTLAGFLGATALAGLSIPWPSYLEPLAPGALVDWLQHQTRYGRKPLLVTYPSMAVRAATLARQQDIRLGGVVMLVAGEPVTAARREAIEASGARCLPLFGCTETGESAESCLNGISADDMHLYSHRFALTSRQRMLGEHLNVNALQFTSLSLSSPTVFLNGETGDAGVIEQRRCGCPWEAAGFDIHVRDIWSFSKLTVEAAAIPGADVFALLEIELPRLFGGGPGDYQLASRPAPNGLTRLVLRRSPALPQADLSAVRQAFLDGLVSTGASSRVFVDFLRDAGQFEAVGETPVTQPGGKSLPVMLRGVLPAGRSGEGNA
jgi:hypothetical protein